MGQNFSSEPVVEKETERDHNDIFNVAVSSCQGWRMSQEDNHSLILDLPGEHKAAFFAVYDGHGSARVSKHASESLWRHLVENDTYTKGNFKEALEQAFLTFDREVNESYNAQLAGTTAVCLLIADNIIYCANIGDSRGVACVNCECIPLSHDHKPENPQELKRILAAGGYVLGNRVNGNLALSRAFGDFHYKGNEQLPPEQQIVSPCPDIKLLELNDDVDFLVLACDGIWDVLSSEEVVEFVIARLEQNMEPGLICEQLTTRCLATDYELVIGCDNMTVLLICYTRGRSWVDFCTDIFNKNTRRLGVPRLRPSAESSTTNNSDMIDTTIATNRNNNNNDGQFDRINPGEYYNIINNVFSSDSSNNNETTENQQEEDDNTSNLQNLIDSSNKVKEEDQKEEEKSISNNEDDDKNIVLRELDHEPELEQTETINEESSNNQTDDKDDKQEQCSIQTDEKEKEQEEEDRKFVQQDENLDDNCKLIEKNHNNDDDDTNTETCQNTNSTDLEIKEDSDENDVSGSNIINSEDNNTDLQQQLEKQDEQVENDNSSDDSSAETRGLNEDENSEDQQQQQQPDDQPNDESNSESASQNNEVEVES